MTVHELYPYTGAFLEVDGGRLHYLDEGNSEDNSQPVMLAVHGNPTWSFYWRQLIQSFAGQYRVVVPDISAVDFPTSHKIGIIDWPNTLTICVSW